MTLVIGLDWIGLHLFSLAAVISFKSCIDILQAGTFVVIHENVGSCIK
jgi:hypothetical protein